MDFDGQIDQEDNLIESPKYLDDLITQYDYCSTFGLQPPQEIDTYQLMILRHGQMRDRILHDKQFSQSTT